MVKWCVFGLQIARHRRGGPSTGKRCEMTTTLKFVTVLLATTMFLTAAQAGEKAQAAEKEQSENFFNRLVKAALPKGTSVKGIVNSGSLGVTFFLLCEVGKNADGNPPDNGKCPK